MKKIIQISKRLIAVIAMTLQVTFALGQFLYDPPSNTYSSAWHIGIGLTAPNNWLQVKDLINFDPHYSNTFLSFHSGFSNTIGSDNIAIGIEAMYSNDTGKQNVALGNMALLENSTGSFNTALGYTALLNNDTGIYNTATGLGALMDNDFGNYNTANGTWALSDNDTGSYNTGVGFSALGENQGGNYNTGLGFEANVGVHLYINNATAIGANAWVMKSNTMILGDTNVWVGIGLSGDTSGPKNSLEINARRRSGAVAHDSSGLRFRQLTAKNIPQLNMGKKGVLALDSSGDVIYVKPDTNTVNGIGTCGTPTTLTANGAIDLANHNLFIDNGTILGDTINSVLIGKSCGVRPLGKLDVLQGTGISHHISTAENSIGINVLDTFSYPSSASYQGQSIGIKSHVNGSNNINIAGKFISENAINNVGGMFIVKDSLASTNYAGYFTSKGGNGNQNLASNTFGGYFEANGGSSFANSFGIRTKAIRPSGFHLLVNNYGIYAEGNSPGWAGWFQGNVNIVGTAICTSGSWSPSDSILKQNKANITNALGLISQLKPQTYNFDTVNYSFMNLPSGKQFGLYAEETNAIVPEIVKDFTFPEQFDDAGNVISPKVDFKGLNYTGLIPIAIQAIKDLDSAVTVLQNTTPPNEPILSYPANKTNSIPLQVTLSWEKSARATGYTVFINLSAQSAATATSITPMASSIIINTNDTFVTVTLPNYNTQYTWYVIAYNNAGSSSMSVQWNFTTLLPQLPTAPVLVLPYNSSIGLPLANSFTWNTSAAASLYTLYISTDSTYSNTVYIINVSDTFANATVPNYNSTYYWWVVSGNVSGQSQASDIWNFSTMPQQQSAAIQLVYPPNNSLDVPSKVTLSWNNSVKATNYTVYVSPMPSNISMNGTSTDGSITLNTTDTLINVVLPNNQTTYIWTVIANNSDGSINSSVKWVFTTQLPSVPDAADLESPLISTTGLTLANTFTWNKSTVATNYTLVISTDSTYNNVVNKIGVSDTFAFAIVPNYNTTYYWWVIASNVSGLSPASDIWNFTTTMQPPSTPQLATPIDGDTVIINPQKPILYLNWQNSLGADFYTVYLSLTPDKSGIIEKDMVADTFTYFKLPYDTTYYWWVVAVNKKSNEAAISDVWNFIVKPVGYNISKQITEPTLSDQTLIKSPMRGINNAMKLISQMETLQFYWDTINHTWLPSTQQIGLNGQQLNHIVPQVVFKDANGYYNIQYGRLAPIFVEGMKELNSNMISIDTTLQGNIDSLNKEVNAQNGRIDSLTNIISGYESRFDSLEAMITRCCGNTNARTVNNNDNSGQNEAPSIHNIELANNAILYQNSPNPFGNGTTIKYFVPDYADAQIIFYDEYGNQIKKYIIEEKGMGQLNVDASNLSSGLYSYSLVVNGKVIDSKKMVCSK